MDCIVENRTETLENEVDEARDIAQHLLECYRNGTPIRMDLPDWLEDSAGEIEK